MKNEKGLKKNESPNILLIGILVITVSIFCFSLFKNISYPLLWNDESESVMAGVRILEYGYPKVHDGKNTVISSLAPNINAGYKEEYDANIYMTWGNYYWAAIGAYFAKNTDDIYLKTALIRLPFTITGLIGLLLFSLAVRHTFTNKNKYLFFLILFTTIEIFSISLVLHMREARYFSLVIFLSGAFYYLYSKRFIEKKHGTIKYISLMFTLLFLTYHINFIAFAIFCAILGFNIGISFISGVVKKSKNIKLLLKELTLDSIPVIIAGVAIIPFLIFFETFKISKVISEHTKFTYETYKVNIGMIYNYLTNLEFANTFLLITLMWLIALIISLKKNDIAKKKDSKTILSNLEKHSLFLTSFFIIYALMIARTPYLFVRHYIVLQPIMVLITTINIFSILNRLEILQPGKAGKIWKYVLSTLFIFIFYNNAKSKIPYMKEHYYEMTHQYKGVLDFIIPYIKENFPNPENLVIATDYEEFSYMYYLNSKVTIGYVLNNLEDDLKHQPDIIMYRKSWGGNPQIFNDFMQKEKYEKITFPVADYPVNNIPELEFSIKHLFKTKYARNEQEKAEIWVRASLLKSLNLSAQAPTQPTN